MLFIDFYCFFIKHIIGIFTVLILFANDFIKNAYDIFYWASMIDMDFPLVFNSLKQNNNYRIELCGFYQFLLFLYGLFMAFYAFKRIYIYIYNVYVCWFLNMFFGCFSAPGLVLNPPDDPQDPIN